MRGLGEVFAKVTSEKSQEPIGAELNAALNGGEYELRHSKSDANPVKDPSVANRFSKSEMSQKVNNAPKVYGERSASLQAQTDALCNDVTKDAQSNIEMEDF